MTRARDLADSADKDIAGTVTLDDIILSNDITLADNGKAIFGAGSDLQIYHDGADSVIYDGGTGNLKLLGTNVVINNSGNTANIATFNDGSDVRLFYNGSLKLATTSTGVDITGTLVSDGLTVDGNVVLNDQSVELGSTSNSYNELRFFDSVNTSGTTRLRSSAGILETYTSNAKRMSINSTGDITFYDTDGTTASFVYDASAGTTFNEAGADRDFRVESDSNTHMLFVDAGNNKVGVNTSSPQHTLHVNQIADNSGIILGYSPRGAGRVQLVLSGGSNEGCTFQHFDSTTQDLLHMSRTETIFNDGGNNTDFRVEGSGDANLIFADASQDRVYVGISANVENAKFGIAGGKSISSGIPYGGLGVTDTNAMAQSVGGGISLNGKYKTDGTYTSFAGIEAEKENGTDNHYGGKLILKARKNGGANITRLELGQSEAVFNQDSEDTDFRVESASNANMLFVDASANEVLIGSSSNNISSQNVIRLDEGFFAVSGTISSGTNQIVVFNNTSTAGTAQNQFRVNGVAKGSIAWNNTATTYNTTSDRRLKTDIQPIADATDKLMAMNPVKHGWKANPDADAVHGFIAQEMQEIVPEAVSGDPNGEEMMSMDYGRITPVLVAALQDAHKKIEALEERLAELEAK